MPVWCSLQWPCSSPLEVHHPHLNNTQNLERERQREREREREGGREGRDGGRESGGQGGKVGGREGGRDRWREKKTETLLNHNKHVWENTLILFYIYMALLTIVDHSGI